MLKARGQSIHIWALAIFSLAFGLRVLHVAAIYKNSPFFDILPGDLNNYDRWARQIVAQGWLGKEIFYQDPLYPYFLALFYKVIGRDFFWLYTTQAFLGGLTSLLLVVLGNRLFGRSVGIFAGLLYGLYGPAIYFDGLVLKVTLSTFLFTLAIYLFLSKELKEAGPNHYFSGLCLGLACLTRANFLLLLPVVFGAILLHKPAGLAKRLSLAFLFLAGLITALGPVVARNYYVGHELVLTTAQAGQNFYIGHNPDATGTYIKLPFVRPDPLYEQEDFKKEAEDRTGRKLNAGEVSQFWLQQAMTFIKTEPLADLKLSARKLWLFLNNYEIPDNHNFYFHKRYSGILQVVPVSFGLVAPFFLLGLLGMLLAKRAAPLFLFFVQVVYMVSVIMFYVFSRYRMVALPLFCLSAGYGLFMLQSQFRLGQWRKLGASLLIVAVGFGIANSKASQPFDFSHSYTDEGIAYEMRDEPEKARKSYEAALEINPGYRRALDKLGKLQLQLKDYKGARKTYTRILAVDPESVEAKYQVMLLDKLGL